MGRQVAVTAPLDSKLADALERVGAALRHGDQLVATQVGLSVLQLRTLRLIATTPPGRRRVGELAAELQVAQPTLSDALRLLIDKELVERRPDPGDRRAVTVQLTPAGDALMDDVRDPHALLGPSLAGLDTGDKEAALAVLLDLIADLYDRGVVSVARMCVTCRHFQRDVHPEPGAPHHCGLLQMPLHPALLRLDCPEHAPRATAST